MHFRKLYLTEDPAWQEAKEEWLTMGEPEKKCLVNLLILDIKENAVRSRLDSSGNPEPGWRRPVQELVSLGDEAKAGLFEALKVLRDETVVFPCIEALAGIADFKDVEDPLQLESHGDNASFQCRLVRVLQKMEDPRALELVLKILNGSYDWRVRATAADVLQDYKGPDFDDVKIALEKALKDEDEFVASKAKDALQALGERRSLER